MPPGFSQRATTRRISNAGGSPQLLGARAAALPGWPDLTALLKVIIAFLFFLVLVAQFLVIPDTASSYAHEAPEYSYLQMPLVIVSIIGLSTIQIVLICLWRLVTIAKRGRVFQAETFRWVNAIIYTCAAAFAIVVITVLAISRIMGPVEAIVLITAGAIAAGVGLLVVVLRKLLAEAIAAKIEKEAALNELAGVI